MEPKDETQSIDLFAFWPREGRYRSARVSRMESDGSVTQTGYGGPKGTLTVKPILLTPVAAGEQLAKGLKKIDEDLDVEISRLHGEARDAREILLGMRK